ncbi:uncharacterized protein YndB with AHSA1/START domain [Pseudonocardia eucalypti]|uniref:hypothetical protein n=1 Tax=Pseudonocardia eucalypti TaxID=648755 RepID=UPI0017C77180|nr:uncharacterized protein YndB with AHSA1/START domain [Pseudonocardia eucalypti]
MSDDSRLIRVSRAIDAPAKRVFAFLANAENHQALDTSGMVRGSADHARLDRVGAVFVMNMYNPIMGDHQVENHVVVYEPDRALGWAPSEPGAEPAGHTYVYRLTPLAHGRTEVSQTYDWSAFTHLDMIGYLPVVNRDELLASLDLLAAALDTPR